MCSRITLKEDEYTAQMVLVPLWLHAAVAI
nr:MAG TPA: hypothetical protein [Caudoviricetes sp.]